MTRSLSVALLALAAAGCGSKSPAKPAQPTDPAGGNAALTAQIEQGKQLYGASCAKCHGDAGQGTDKGPPVVGKEAFPLDPRPGAKRDVQFRTAADVFGWTIKHMPGDAPGSLQPDQYLAIFAFDLTANGVQLSAPLDGEAAAKIVLHP